MHASGKSTSQESKCAYEGMQGRQRVETYTRDMEA